MQVSGYSSTLPYSEGILNGFGSVSNKQAIEKSTQEYEKYCEIRKNQLSEVEKVYLDNIKLIEQQIKKK